MAGVPGGDNLGGPASPTGPTAQPDLALPKGPMQMRKCRTCGRVYADTCPNCG